MDRSLSDFKFRCRRKLEDLGDTTLNAQQYDEAITHYTAALSLNLTTPQTLVVSIGLREKTCSFMWCRILWGYNRCIRDDALEDVAII